MLWCFLGLVDLFIVRLFVSCVWFGLLFSLIFYVSALDLLHFVLLLDLVVV